MSRSRSYSECDQRDFNDLENDMEDLAELAEENSFFPKRISMSHSMSHIHQSRSYDECQETIQAHVLNTCEYIVDCATFRLRKFKILRTFPAVFFLRL